MRDIEQDSNSPSGPHSGPATIKDFETAIAELESIVKKLEDGDLALEASLQLYERGVHLSRFCHSRLEEAERRIEILNERGQLRPAAGGPRRRRRRDDAHAMTDATAVAEYVRARRAEVEAALATLLPAPPGCPAPVADAMRYSLTGRRQAPAAGAVPGQRRSRRRLRRPPCCRPRARIELIHTYSLIHDDLPAMDDDSMRRGRPTLHVVAGEGMAILAGDGLLTEAFRVLASACAGDAGARAARDATDRRGGRAGRHGGRPGHRSRLRDAGSAGPHGAAARRRRRSPRCTRRRPAR